MVTVQIDSETKCRWHIQTTKRTKITECNISVCMDNVRNKTGWEVPCSRQQIWAEDFEALVKTAGIKGFGILEHWRDMIEVTL